MQAVFQFILIYREQKTHKKCVLRGELQVNRLPVFLLMSNTAQLTKNKGHLRLHGQQQKTPNNSATGYLTEINQILLWCKSSLKTIV